MRYIIFLILLFPFILKAQLSDNFTDGDFTANPQWVGSTGSFVITTGTLQSNGPNAASSKIYLATQNALINNTEWNFLVDLRFAPSSTNYTRIYLVSDTLNLSSSQLHGYYLQIGQSNEDTIKFFKQNGATSTLLYTGSTRLATATANVKVRIKVSRDNNGLWQFYTDKTGGANLVQEAGSVTDITYTTTQYFGVSCIYSTASRFNLYYFDDFEISQPGVDIVPPLVSSVNVTSASTIDIIFSEVVEINSAQNISNYSIVSSNANPSTAIRDAGNQNTVHLTFSSAFASNISDSILIQNVTDIAGNPVVTIKKEFIYQNLPPTIVSVSPTSQNSLSVVFNQDLETTSAQNTLNYFISNNIGNPTSAAISGGNNYTVDLVFMSNFNSGQTDTLYVYNVSGLTNNPIDTAFKTFMYISVPDSISDNFTDGDFTNGTIWSGDDSLFNITPINSDNALNSWGTVSSAAYLSSPVLFNDTMEWRFYIRQNFDPSSSNYSKVFLLSDSPNLKGSLNGYYLLFGETSTTDVVRLYKQSGTSSALVCSGNTSLVGGFSLNIKVVNKGGIWTIYSAIPGTSSFITEGSGTDVPSGQAGYFGMYCKYTSGNIKNFFFDNIYAGPVVPDLTAPFVTQITVASQNAIDIKFSEPVEKISSELSINYNVDNSIGNPGIASRDLADSSLVHLTFTGSFTPNLQNTLNINGVKDYAGNTLSGSSHLFTYIVAPDSIFENFNDGDFTQNPVWHGDDSLFIVTTVSGNNFLQSWGNNASVSHLSSPVVCRDSMEWRFQIKADWDATYTTTWSRIYLMSDNANLEGSLNGYFLQFRESTGNQRIKLYRQEGTTTTLVSSGVTNIANPFNLKIKVTRDATGQWAVYSSSDGGLNYIQECVATDNIVTQNSTNFGFYYKYISTTNKKLWIDDILVRKLAPNIHGNNTSIESPLVQLQADTIFSFENDTSLAVPVFKFKVSDLGDSYASPLKIVQIKITNPSPAGGAEWINTIGGVTLSDGSNIIKPAHIVLDNNFMIIPVLDTLVIPDNSSKELTLSVFLKQGNGNLIDDSKLQFSIDANHGWIADTSGSGLPLVTNNSIVSEIFTINVVATKLVFGTIQNPVIKNTDFALSAIIADKWNNIDKSSAFSTILSLETGTGNLTSTGNLNQISVSGICNWTGLKYDSTGYFRLKVESASLGHDTISNKILSVPINSTVIESFSDFNYNSNPVWFGDTSSFFVEQINNDTMLHLSAVPPAPNQYKAVYLATTLQYYDSLEWRFDVDMNFTPSSSNYSRFYLASDNAQLTGNLNGYFIQIGTSTGYITLYKQKSDGSITEVMHGVKDVSDGQVHLSVRITRKPGGVWSVYWAPQNTEIYRHDKTGTDSEFTNFIFCGVFGRFSQSNAHKFYFDDIYCGKIIPDLTAPFVVYAIPTTFNTMDVYFSEEVEISSAQVLSNYYINTFGNSPMQCILDNQDRTIAHLTFPTSIPADITDTLFMKNLRDLSGNTALLNKYKFQFFNTLLENFNDGNLNTNPIWSGDTALYSITSNNGNNLMQTGVLPSQTSTTADLFLQIAPKPNMEWRFYVNLAFDPSTTTFSRIHLISDNSDFGNDAKRSYYLQLGESNETDVIRLFRHDEDGTDTLICSGTTGIAAGCALYIRVTRQNGANWKIFTASTNELNYLLEASGTDSKYSGAPLSFFGLSNTYSSSTNPESHKFLFDDFYVGNIIPDTVAPAILSVLPETQYRMLVKFSEEIDQSTGLSIQNYVVNNNVGNPVICTFPVPNDKSTVRLEFANGFPDALSDTLWVFRVKDPSGNAIDTTFAVFQYLNILRESFTDGNFTSNPAWSGTQNSFICSGSNGSYSLQSQTTEPALNAYLSVQTAIHDTMEWRFRIKVGFSPTSTSYARVYLMSKNSVLNASVNDGYYLQFGESNEGDVIRLYRQDGTDPTLVCSGTTSIADAFDLNVRVLKFPNGEWKIYTFAQGTDIFTEEVSGDDNHYSFGNFGVLCKASSSSYFDKFLFDDFYAGPPIKDTIAPVAVSVNVESVNSLSIEYSEEVNPVNSILLSNYFVNNNIGNPNSASLSGKTVTLTFTNNFTDGITDSLYIYNLQDLSGNTTASQAHVFRYMKTADTLIEKFDDGNFTVNPCWTGNENLFAVVTENNNYKLRLNGSTPQTARLTTKVLMKDSMEWRFNIDLRFSPSSTTYARTYLAFDNENIGEEGYGYFLQFGESNSGDVIRLYRQDLTETVLLCSGITNISSAFNLDVKVVRTSDGNWAIYTSNPGSENYIFEAEIIDSLYNHFKYFGFVCKFSTASYANGFLFDNIYAGPITKDTASPEISSVLITSHNSIDIVFSEPVNENTAESTANFFLDQGAGIPVAAIRDNNDKAVVHLQFAQTLTDGTYYTVFAFNIADVSNNVADTLQENFFYIAAPTVINERFTDGELFSNPRWNGDDGDFFIDNDGILNLFSVSSGYDTSYLSSPVFLQQDSIEWRIKLKLNFNPSSNNWARFYLMSDNSSLKQSTRGYFLQFGEDGSGDAIELVRTDGNSKTVICRGQDGLISESPELRIKVKHSRSGDWLLYADTTLAENFQFQAAGFDSTYQFKLFNTGILCRYSSTYASGKFSFDDIYAGKLIKDTVAPEIVKVVIADSMNIDLLFSENLQSVYAENLNNYFISNSIGVPEYAVPNYQNKSIVSLTLSSPVKQDIVYTITVSNMKDEQGNIANPPISKSFSYHIVKPYEIVINEIMADPTPVVGLPDQEYIELFNKSAFSIDITGWRVKIGSSYKTIPAHTMLPGSFLILTSAGSEGLYSNYGTAFGILSSDGLTNSGNSISLINPDGMIVSSVVYSDDWYGSTTKSEGGWSLEQIYPSNPCGGSNNWGASVNTKGGTPGTVNSIFSAMPDTEVPELLHAVVLSTRDSVRVFFSEPVYTNTLQNSNFLVDNNVGYPMIVTPDAPENTSVVLVFPQQFEVNKIYNITVSSSLSDCVGNSIGTSNSCKFAVSTPPAPGDIVINEVLFNPIGSGSDFVEIYNRSTAIINLREVKLATRSTEDLQITDVTEIAPEGRLIFPGEYMVLTENIENIKQQYLPPPSKNYITIESMPTYGNTSGEVVLTDKSMIAIDDFLYDEKMHYPLLSTTEGVTLERVNFDRPTTDKGNWHSAAGNVLFGTPSYKNSQYSDIAAAEDIFTLTPDVFSPDNDGHNDMLNIAYKLDKPEYTANITIFDSKGRQIKQLAKNQLLPVQGSFSWDGITDGNTKAEIGIYVVYIEYFTLDGNVKKLKKTCVVAGKLN